MSFPHLIPMCDTPLKLRPLLQRPSGYDPFYDEVRLVHLGRPEKGWPMTRWQMFLVGCGIQPDLWDAVNRRYVPFEILAFDPCI